MAKPDADVTYKSSRSTRELTGLGAVDQFVQNSQTDYLNMLAQGQQQQAANKQPVGGSGLGKLNEAIAGSPQLQSGLMAAGLSLMFGNDVETAVTAGLGAASNYNQQVQQEEESTKAQLLAGAKQQSQMEHSYEQGNLFQRQPDNFNVQAARISAGAADRQLGQRYLELLAGIANNERDRNANLGLPLAPLPIDFASAAGSVNERASAAGVQVPGVTKLGADPGTTQRVAPSLDQKEYLKALRDALVAKNMSPAQVDAVMKQEIANRGLALRYPNVATLYADFVDVVPANAKQDKTPPKPTKPTAPTPKPSSATSIDAALLRTPKAEPKGPRVDQKAIDKKKAEAEKQRLIYKSLLPQTEADLDRLFKATF